MDDAACLFYRLPVGGGCGRENRGVYFSDVELVAALQSCRPAGILAAPDPWNRAHSFSSHGELPRHSRERKFPEDHDVHGAADIRSPGRYQRGSRSARKLSPDFPRDAICLHSADSANCAVFYDWIRIRPQVCGRSQTGVSRKKLPYGHRPGLGCRSTFLCCFDCGRGLHRALAELVRAALRDGHCIRARDWSKVAGGVDFVHGVFRPVAMFQWQFCRIHSPAFCLRTATYNSRELWNGSPGLSDTFHCDNRNYGGDSCRAFSRRRAAYSCDGSGFDGVGLGMVCGLSLCLDGGETDIHANRDRARDCRLSAAFPDESSARIPRAFFAVRMECLRHLGASRRDSLQAQGTSVKPAERLVCQKRDEQCANCELAVSSRGFPVNAVLRSQASYLQCDVRPPVARASWSSSRSACIGLGGFQQLR